MSKNYISKNKYALFVKVLRNKNMTIPLIYSSTNQSVLEYLL